LIFPAILLKRMSFLPTTDPFNLNNPVSQQYVRPETISCKIHVKSGKTVEVTPIPFKGKVQISINYLMIKYSKDLNSDYNIDITIGNGSGLTVPIPFIKKCDGDDYMAKKVGKVVLTISNEPKHHNTTCSLKIGNEVITPFEMKCYLDITKYMYV